MEATKKIKMAPTWLGIELCQSREANKINIQIIFSNNSDEVNELCFSNANHKAEFLGLLIINYLKERIIPKHNLIIKSISSKVDKKIMNPGDKIEHTLNGEIIDNNLQFIGSIFELNKDELYKIRFKYLGIVSNEIFFKI